MNTRSFSGTALEKALKEGALTQPAALLTGMVKASEKSGHIGFSMSACDAWVDLPTDLIEHAERIGQRPCQDHSHPVMSIALKEPQSAEGRIFIALLVQSQQNLVTETASPMPSAGAGFPLMPNPLEALAAASQDPKCVADCAKIAASISAACAFQPPIQRVACLAAAFAFAGICQRGCYRLFPQDLLDQVSRL